MRLVGGFRTGPLRLAPCGSTSSDAPLRSLLMRLGPMELVIITATCLLYLWPVWRICRKAGFPGALALLCLVPLANFGLLWFLASVRVAVPFGLQASQPRPRFLE